MLLLYLEIVDPLESFPFNVAAVTRLKTAQLLPLLWKILRSFFQSAYLPSLLCIIIMNTTKMQYVIIFLIEYILSPLFYERVK